MQTIKRLPRIVKRIVVEAMNDNVTGEAAKVAFYLFLSFFPAILVLFALTGILGGDAAFNWIMGRIETIAPGQAGGFLSRFVRQVTNQERPGMLSVGILIMLWAASGGFAALGDGLNTMYNVKERRSWWKKRLVALGLMVAAVVLLIGGALIVVAGPALIETMGMSPLATALRWPLAFLLVLALLWLIYYVLPNRDQARSKWLALFGAAVGALAWLAVTGLFRLYVANFASYGETYGFVGAVMVLMLWLYLSALAFLIGGETASTIEQIGNEARTGHASGTRTGDAVA